MVWADSQIWGASQVTQLIYWLLAPLFSKNFTMTFSGPPYPMSNPRTLRFRGAKGLHPVPILKPRKLWTLISPLLLMLPGAMLHLVKAWSPQSTADVIAVLMEWGLCGSWTENWNSLLELAQDLGTTGAGSVPVLVSGVMWTHSPVLLSSRRQDLKMQSILSSFSLSPSQEYLCFTYPFKWNSKW